ncbi:hypothetical protein SNEBB_005507 [Seison nebaliae]|nr:hypothetical protein SNEBB_005507 [Seison nebaliae]
MVIVKKLKIYDAENNLMTIGFLSYEENDSVDKIRSRINEKFRDLYSEYQLSVIDENNEVVNEVTDNIPDSATFNAIKAVMVYDVEQIRTTAESIIAEKKLKGSNDWLFRLLKANSGNKLKANMACYMITNLQICPCPEVPMTCGYTITCGE